MPVTPVVVVIEDTTELGEVIRDVMTEEGYDVLHVRDQFAAVATLRNQRVDLVVADVPPRGPGDPNPISEILREYPDVPLLVIDDQPPDDAPFFGPWRVSGTRATLLRPFKLDHLLAAARELVG